MHMYRNIYICVCMYMCHPRCPAEWGVSAARAGAGGGAAKRRAPPQRGLPPTIACSCFQIQWSGLVQEGQYSGCPAVDCPTRTTVCGLESDVLLLNEVPFPAEWGVSHVTTEVFHPEPLAAVFKSSRYVQEWSLAGCPVPESDLLSLNEVPYHNFLSEWGASLVTTVSHAQPLAAVFESSGFVQQG